MANEIATYLKFANLQMAAEALLDRIPLVGITKALTDGNNRSSKFTQAQATEFTDPAKGWSVLAHRPNTSTGFSGTLFKNNETRIKGHELRFRSQYC